MLWRPTISRSWPSSTSATGRNKTSGPHEPGSLVTEGDTIYRTAADLRPYLVGRSVLAARASGRAQVSRLVRTTIESIETVGKNLLLHFSGGLSVRTHLRMRGTWRRYAPGEPWRYPAARASLVLEVEGVVAVCFNAPVVELFATRSRSLHPALSRLGPDLMDDAFDPTAALGRMREPRRADSTIGEILLDQTVMAGVGNVYRSEILFMERVNPRAAVHSFDDALLARLIATARTLLLANVGDQRARTRSFTQSPSTAFEKWPGSRAITRSGHSCRTRSSPRPSWLDGALPSVSLTPSGLMPLPTIASRLKRTDCATSTSA